MLARAIVAWRHQRVDRAINGRGAALHGVDQVERREFSGAQAAHAFKRGQAVEVVGHAVSPFGWEVRRLNGGTQIRTPCYFSTVTPALSRGPFRSRTCGGKIDPGSRPG